MKTFAQKFIEDYYFECGQSILMVIRPTENQNLPDEIYKRGEPTLIHLHANRPLNIDFDEDTVSMDLCFNAPPQRVVFQWEDIFLIGTDPEEWNLCSVIAPMIRSEDDATVIGDVVVEQLDIWNKIDIVAKSKPEKSESKKPTLSVVK